MEANSRVSFELSSGRVRTAVTSVAENELEWLIAKLGVFVNNIVYLWLQKCVLGSLLGIDLFFA